MTSVEIAALTAFFGVVVFVLGQIVQRFFIEPMQEQRKLLGEIAFAATFYANVTAGTGRSIDELNQASIALRQLASRLRYSLYTVPLYSVLSALHVVIPQKAIVEAAVGLIGWSVNLYSGNSSDVQRNQIERALNLIHTTSL